MDYRVLIRDPNDEYGEKKAMTELGIHFKENRSRFHTMGLDGVKHPIIIGRYSVLPFYKELEDDLGYWGFKLINSHQQFKYCADLQNWYATARPLTPYTWFTLAEYLADNYEGPVVLKGETNSRRDQWRTHMFANNKDEARTVYCRLLDDGLISQQKIYIRKYEKLKKLIDGVNGMPIPNEWRVFVCYGEVVARAFYWGTYLDDINANKTMIDYPWTFDDEVFIKKVGNNSNFYSYDIAQKEDGEWIVIEMNEGQMSGLNGIEPLDFYTELDRIIKSK